MTPLLKRAVRRIERLPPGAQDRAARLLLCVVEAEEPVLRTENAPADEGRPPVRSAAEIDRELAALREAWES